MPLPSDDRIIQLANDLLTQFDEIFGLHPGFRPAHAKGIMLAAPSLPHPRLFLLCARRTSRAILLL